MTSRRLLVEGWRGISHSFAMVNQHQLLAWRQHPGLTLSHRDLPMYKPHWNSQVQNAGFDEVAAARLDAVAGPGGDAADAIYRIAFPADLSPLAGPATPQFTFIVNECGLRPSYVSPGLSDLAVLTRDGNGVITPSTWSRDLLIRFGIDGARLQVVPHGVCRTTFAPMSEADRRDLRAATGFGDEHFVFSNVGVPLWHKGIDQLLIAFAAVRQRHAGARLILKNHQSLYGLRSETVFHAVNQLHPGLLTPAVLSSIVLIDDNMSQEDLRKLYVCTDCYVSPYRAEGFNLPVLEAMACGTPVIVTAGGATDDYCQNSFAVRVDSRLRDTPENELKGGSYLEIDPDALVDAMSSQLEQGDRRLAGAAWDQWLEAMSWQHAAQRTLDFMFPGAVAADAVQRTPQIAAACAATRGVCAQPAAAVPPPRAQPRPAATPPVWASTPPPTPDFYNPIGYSVIKRRRLLRAFPGVDRVQINHSQLHQDMFVLAALDGLRRGTYLDIGAHEPVFINNTYLLESQFAWRGVSVELDPAHVSRHQALRRNRCVQADATRVDYAALLASADLGPVVDYLSVDTDPPEVTLAALQAIPHDKVRFRVITFEHDYSAGGAAVRQASREFLSDLGYSLVVNDIAWGNRVVEDWWVHPELTDAAVIEHLRCTDSAAHEHDKYIYGAYHAAPRRAAPAPASGVASRV